MHMLECPHIYILGQSMNKIPKEEILAFREDITSTLSAERLKSYDGDIQSYYAIRLLALQAGHKIAEIEIYLRNMLDFLP